MAKVEHSDLVQHQVGIVQQFRKFWMDDHLCDVVLQSSDGAEHRAHVAVLSAASTFFKTLLGGAFLEADRVQRGKPVEIAASKAAVSALLDYIYGGQPEVQLDAGLELLRLAEAYSLPKLAAAIEAGFRASLHSNSALQILQEGQGLHALKVACEEKVAEDFENCSQHAEFGKLRPGQLARILKREDLRVSREEAVLKGLLNWLKVSKDRNASLGMLLQHVDFQSISVENLFRLGRFTLSGPTDDDLQREVDEALRIRQRKRIESPPIFQPKRRCLQHWSPDLGASTDTSGPQREVCPTPCYSMRWHGGAIYATDFQGSVLRLKPGDPATHTQQLVGQGVRVTGIEDLGPISDLAVAPTGEIFVADVENERLVSIQNGSGRIVLHNLQSHFLVFCSPNGVLYVMGHKLQKLVGSVPETILDEDAMQSAQWKSTAMFVTKEEVLYVVDNDNNRILSIDPAESLELVLVGQVQQSNLVDLFVTESRTIYVADQEQRKVLAFRRGSTTCTEVLKCPDPLFAVALLVQGRSLYVSICDDMVEPTAGGIYEYALPLEIELE